MTPRTRSLTLALAAACVAHTPSAQPQDFPQRPVRMVVPYGPGGITDITARILAPGMGDDLGQQVVVDNRPGGAAIPGFDLVAKAKPDGHTIVAATTALAAQPILFRKLPYQADRDFTPVSLVILVPTVLVVHPSVPARSVKQLVALAKAKPGALEYGSAGNGTDNHLTTEVFKHAAGIDALHVPYKGGGAVMGALAAGEIAFVFATLPSAHSFVTASRLRALAVSGLKRNPALPDVPTVDEAAIPGFNVNAWLGLFGPGAMSKAATERLHAATVKTLQHPKVIERLQAIGAEVVGSTPAELQAHLRTETNRWLRLDRDVKFQRVD